MITRGPRGIYTVLGINKKDTNATGWEKGNSREKRDNNWGNYTRRLG